jgi:hypothetical protein
MLGGSLVSMTWRVKDEEDGRQLWTVAANILNSQQGVVLQLGSWTQS